METKLYPSVVAAHAAHCANENYQRLCNRLRKGPFTTQNGCIITRLSDGQIAVQFEVIEAIDETPDSSCESLNPNSDSKNDRVEQLWQGWVDTGRLAHWKAHLAKTRNVSTASLHRRDQKWWQRRFCWESGMQSLTVWKEVWDRYRQEMTAPPSRRKAVIEEPSRKKAVVEQQLTPCQQPQACHTDEQQQACHTDESRYPVDSRIRENDETEEEVVDPNKADEIEVDDDYVGSYINPCEETGTDQLVKVLKLIKPGIDLKALSHEAKKLPIDQLLFVYVTLCESEMRDRQQPTPCQQQQARGQRPHIMSLSLSEEANSLTRKYTAFSSFYALMDAEGGYIPSFNISNPEIHRLADIYDDENAYLPLFQVRKCFRYEYESVPNQQPTPCQQQQGWHGTRTSVRTGNWKNQDYSYQADVKTQWGTSVCVKLQYLIEDKVGTRRASLIMAQLRIKKASFRYTHTGADRFKISAEEVERLISLVEETEQQATPCQQQQANAALVIPFAQAKAVPTHLVESRVEVPNLPAVLEGSEPSSEPVRNRDWLTVQQVSELLGISERAVRKSITVGKYLTRQVNSKGGPGGMRYEIATESLPEPFKSQWYDKVEGQLRLQVVDQQFDVASAPLEDPNYEVRIKKARWIENHIKPIVRGTEPYSAERSKRIKEFVQTIQEDWNGRGIKNAKRGTLFSEPTVYNWIRAYEKGGILGLMRKERTDRNQKRILISRIWDRAFIGSLQEKQCQQIADEMTTYIASLWAAGATGRTSIGFLAAQKLQELTAQSLNENTTIGNTSFIKEVCQVSTTEINDLRERYRLLYLKANDAKQFYDHISPRVIRDWSNYLPNDIWIGDVRPLDIRLLRDDGHEVYPRVISWYDVATHIRIDVMILCQPHEGVKQTHVALAFMAAVSHLGLPKKLYLDNGSEYNFTEMLEAFNELNRLGYRVGVELGIPTGISAVDSEQTVVRAQPYNARAKSIEGSFGVWARTYEPNIQGYVGGQREKKLKSKMGGQPHTYEGNLEQLHTEISVMLNSYHKRPQSGHLKGRSPIDAYNQYVEKGWQAIGVDQTALALAMSEKDTRIVQAGGVISYKPKDFPKYEAVFYMNAEFSDCATRRVPIRVLRHDPNYIFAYHPETGWKVCPLYQPSDALSREGIETLRNARRHLKRVISERKGQVYRLDLVEEWENWNQQQPDFLPTPFAALIEGDVDIQQMKQAYETKANTILAAVETPTQQRIPSRWQTDEGKQTPQITYADE